MVALSEESRETRKGPLAPDVLSAAFKADPFPTLARMRAEGPVIRMKFPFIGRLWMTTTHAAALAVAKDASTFVLEGRNAGRSGTIGIQWWMPKSIVAMANNMLTKDDPDHRRLRRLVDKAFSRRDVLNMRNDVVRLADKLIDQFEHESEVDLVQSYSRRLPLEVICDLLGLEHKNRSAFLRWGLQLANLDGPLALARLFRGLDQVSNLLREEMKEVRRSPRAGLLTELVRAEDDGDKLSEPELLSMVFLLLVAGFETTTNLIAGSVVALESHPDQKAWLLQAPEDRVELAVEELARHVSAVQATKPRYVARDVDFFGQSLKRGEIIMACIAAANADPDVFEAPEELRLDRLPNPHLAFSSGVHFCLGMQLARLETQVALSRFYERLPNLQISASNAITYSARPGMRGISSLIVQTRSRALPQRVH